MKRISEWLSSVRPIRLVLSSMLCALLFFAGGCSSLAAKTTPANADEGTAQLDDISNKSQQALDNSQDITKSNEKGINEVQGSADRDKMIRSDRAQSPAVDKAEEVLNNVKKS